MAADQLIPEEEQAGKLYHCPLKPSLECAATHSLALSSSCCGCRFQPPEILELIADMGGQEPPRKGAVA